MKHMVMSRRWLTFITVLAWLITCPLYGYYYVVSTLASPEPYDEYARHGGFQLLMFSIFRLPLLFVALLLLIGLELIAFDLWKDCRASRVQQ